MRYLKHILYSVYTVMTCICILHFSSCSFVATTSTIEVSLPSAYNEHTVDYWFVFYSGGTPETENTQGLMLQSGDSLSIEVPLNTPAAILAYPIVQGIKEKPCGLIVPYDTVLSFDNGFAAYILYRLYVQTENTDSKQVQEFVSCFNWQRFIDMCHSVSDIWSVDSDRVVLAIASGTFKKSLMAKKKKG